MLTSILGNRTLRGIACGSDQLPALSVAVSIGSWETMPRGDGNIKSRSTTHSKWVFDAVFDTGNLPLYRIIAPARGCGVDCEDADGAFVHMGRAWNVHRCPLQVFHVWQNSSGSRAGHGLSICFSRVALLSGWLDAIDGNRASGLAFFPTTFCRHFLQGRGARWGKAFL
eukprot:TRINITY_DN36228_c0_g1_i1.p1 TRINITY_DN36228_c0_g1~~TRINITY_DN36228_c0_g1_i1.p1  ORF type:complete len:169 (-),score=18.18 TRINITY_DN36228_c0_g1_i1:64-570(-)